VTGQLRHREVDRGQDARSLGIAAGQHGHVHEVAPHGGACFHIQPGFMPRAQTRHVTAPGCRFDPDEIAGFEHWFQLPGPWVARRGQTVDEAVLDQAIDVSEAGELGVVAIAKGEEARGEAAKIQRGACGAGDRQHIERIVNEVFNRTERQGQGILFKRS
jgi:hypothetical protein